MRIDIDPVGVVPVYRSSSYLFPTGYGTLGYGLPAAIGAKVASPDQPVVGVLGDGGVRFTVAELATAAELRLALPVVDQLEQRLDGLVGGYASSTPWSATPAPRADPCGGAHWLSPTATRRPGRTGRRVIR
ncbi:MAG: thiamine pyrophosphate-dependent enzyme [Humibacillus sp.]|nr:thiamine pyrophosphate-dependent enzyme [Humibacillus sp.]MDN5778613.1 thiamine pyrophosphate-dependent enzyme [Humibacillus sp.]